MESIWAELIINLMPTKTKATVEKLLWFNLHYDLGKKLYANFLKFKIFILSYIKFLLIAYSLM